jgi:hypothetical protein
MSKGMDRFEMKRTTPVGTVGGGISNERRRTFGLEVGLDVTSSRFDKRRGDRVIGHCDHLVANVERKDILWGKGEWTECDCKVRLTLYLANTSMVPM